MDTYANQVTNYLLTQSWQIALLAVIVGLITFALRNRSAHMRYLLWLIVLAKCLVPPMYSVPVAVLPERSHVEHSMHTAIPSMPIENTVASETAKPVTIEKMPLPRQRQFAAPNMEQTIVLLWLAGVVLFLLWVGGRAIRYTVWLQHRRMPLPPALEWQFRELFAGFKFRKSPKIWLASDIAQPFVWGLFRGSVYLPVDFTCIDKSQHHRTVLVHELSHVARFDAAANVLQILAQAIFWFHPFVWWVNKKIRAEREKCCDEMSVAHLSVPPEHYTDAIVEALAAERRSAHPVPSLAIVGSVKDIEERIKTMLRPGKKFYKRPSFKIAIVLILLAVLIVPISCSLTHREKIETTAEQSQKHYESLYEAAKAGSLSEVKRLIVEGADVNDDTTRQETPLHAAAANGNKEIIELLIANGAIVDANKPGYTPLTWAIWQLDYDSKKDIVEVLVNHGADVNYKPSNDDPAIFYSVWNEDVELAKLLLAHGARLEAKSENGWTVLRHAAAYGNQKLVEFFVSKGADAPEFHLAAFMGDLRRVKNFLDKGMDADTKDEFGWTPLFWAASNAQRDVVEYLIDKGADINICVDGNRTLLHQAARSGELNLAKLLISRGLDINAKDGAGFTPLHHSSRNGHKDVAELLIKNGADVHAGNRNGATPLQLACQIGYKEIIELLVDNGADINSKNNGGGTALHRAAGRCQKDIVEILIVKGADVNARNRGGQSPLHKAAQAGPKTNVELLVSNGANLNAKNNAGATPLDLAEQKGHTEIVELLKKHGAKESPYPNINTNQAPKLRQAVEDGNIERVKQLIEEGADVNVKYRRGTTVLHLASGAGRMDMVELLISKGATINTPDEKGWTPLHEAADKSHVDIVKFLMAEGAEFSPIHMAAYFGELDKIKSLVAKDVNVNEKDTAGFTPLHSAVCGKQIKTTDFLLSNGADANAKDNWGWTPLIWAIWNHDLNTIKLLVDKGAKADVPDEQGFTPLTWATWEQNKDIVKVIISKEPNINTEDTDGCTPLYWAAFSSSNDVFELFLDRLNASESIHFAACKGDLDTVKTFLEKDPNVNVKDKFGCTPLHWAALAKTNEVAEFLIDKGADVNARDNNGLLPLTGTHRLDMIGLLISKGVDVNAKINNRSMTKLHLACRQDNKDMVEYLISKGADLNAKNNRGQTTLDIATNRGHTEIVELLKKHGAKE